MPTLGIGDKSSPLCLLIRGANKITGTRLLWGKRVGSFGLAARGDPAKEEFVDRPYRFAVEGAGVKKEKKNLTPVPPAA